MTDWYTIIANASVCNNVDPQILASNSFNNKIITLSLWSAKTCGLKWKGGSFLILKSFLPRWYRNLVFSSCKVFYPQHSSNTSLRKPLDISHTKPGRWVRRYQGQWSGWRWLHPLFLLWWKIPRFFFSGSIVILYILLHVYTYKKYLAKKSKIHIEVWCGFVDDIDRLQVVCFLDLETGVFFTSLGNHSKPIEHAIQTPASLALFKKSFFFEKLASKELGNFRNQLRCKHHASQCNVHRSLLEQWKALPILLSTYFSSHNLRDFDGFVCLKQLFTHASKARQWRRLEGLWSSELLAKLPVTLLLLTSICGRVMQAAWS